MNDEPEDERTGYELLVPFTAVQSNGGPFDDNAFVAGFEMGKLWVWCSTLRGAGDAVFAMTIHAENRAQADLIAMNFGARIIDVPLVRTDEDRSIAPGPNEWSHIEITWSEPPPGDC